MKKASPFFHAPLVLTVSSPYENKTAVPQGIQTSTQRILPNQNLSILIWAPTYLAFPTMMLSNLFDECTLCGLFFPLKDPLTLR